MIKIRMSRGGKKKQPYYSIVATDARSPRDGRFIEKLGQYVPRSADAIRGIQVDKIREWLSKGAQLSDTVRTILRKHNVQL